MRYLIYLTAWAGLFVSTFSQAQTPTVTALRAELDRINKLRDSLQLQIDDARMNELRALMRGVGFPQGEVIEHSAMCLSYNETHEQADWVMHIIAPEMTTGKVTRTNDFREDPMVATGTAVEADYFLKFLQPDGSYTYDGFGWDRGHLAPSADFRWSEKALSESYFYSNMSPQLADFNRGAWADLEGALRAYLYRNPGHWLYVVTLPVLSADLPVVERGVNKVSVPREFIKVALDREAGAGIAFRMPNRAITEPMRSFAISIDDAEALTGLDFFPNIAEEVAPAEASFALETWLTDEMLGDAEPLFPPTLPKNHFNTVQAAQYVGHGKPVTVCGTVVSTRTSRSGNVWLNLDKQYPNQIFSVYIRKEHLINFSTNPEESLKGQVVCIKGKVMDLNGTPTMRIEKEEVIQPFVPKQ